MCSTTIFRYSNVLDTSKRIGMCLVYTLCMLVNYFFYIRCVQLHICDQRRRQGREWENKQQKKKRIDSDKQKWKNCYPILLWQKQIKNWPLASSCKSFLIVLGITVVITAAIVGHWELAFMPPLGSMLKAFWRKSRLPKI